MKRNKKKIIPGLVSVMIPTYNRPYFFELALKSALNQTYKNIEVIVSDNSTNKETEEVIRRYRHDERLIYRHNIGADKKENFAAFEKIARGEYLQWLMDDDLLHREKIHRSMEVFDMHKDVTLVTSLRMIIDEGGKKKGLIVTPETYAPHLFNEPYQIFEGRWLGRKLILEQSNYLGEPTVGFFRRKDTDEHFWNFQVNGVTYLSDMATWLNLMEKGNCAIFKEPLSYFRIHSDQENRNPDIVYSSLLEHYHLADFFYKRKIFIETRDDYLTSLKSLIQKHESYFKYYCDTCKPDLRKKYLAMIHKAEIMCNLH